MMQFENDWLSSFLPSKIIKTDTQRSNFHSCTVHLDTVTVVPCILVLSQLYRASWYCHSCTVHLDTVTVVPCILVLSQLYSAS